jgi:hypothetical protein
MRPLLALLAAPVLLLICVACGSSPEQASAAEANDTSGCSGLDLTVTRGPVQVTASRPPTSHCWNIEESGYSVTYRWTQTNDDKPQKKNVGFWSSLNGAGTYAKADAYACTTLSGGGLGHDTSGNQYYSCTAQKRLDFHHVPEMKAAGYRSDGGRLPWEVEVAVSLDDNGNWDSLGGANYRFSM